jgi:hypothetical protein
MQMLIFLPREPQYGLLRCAASSPLVPDTCCQDSPTNSVRSVESQLPVQNLEGQCRLLYNRGKPDEVVQGTWGETMLSRRMARQYLWNQSTIFARLRLLVSGQRLRDPWASRQISEREEGSTGKSTEASQPSPVSTEAAVVIEYTGCGLWRGPTRISEIDQPFRVFKRSNAASVVATSGEV